MSHIVGTTIPGERERERERAERKDGDQKREGGTLRE